MFRPASPAIKFSGLLALGPRHCRPCLMPSGLWEPGSAVTSGLALYSLHCEEFAECCGYVYQYARSLQAKLNAEDWDLFGARSAFWKC